jgi:hypothetical protein
VLSQHGLFLVMDLAGIALGIGRGEDALRRGKSIMREANEMAWLRAGPPRQWRHLRNRLLLALLTGLSLVLGVLPALPYLPSLKS